MVRCRPALILLAVSALLLAPSLVLGTMISHSSPQNLTWAEQFADQFRAGVLYPRWLPQSFDGLGSPTFYFYPPIAFWIDALLSVATFNVPSVSYRLSFSTLILLWASGLAMHAWLRAEAQSPRIALYGAIGYMAAPYHLLDHYYRGAFAELAAYVVLPLLALSIRRIAEGRRLAPVLFALAYAALPMAHLPTALLISLTALPLYVLYRGWRFGTARRALGFFVRCALGGALGLGVASIYLVPALGLQSWIPVDPFWISYYRVERWFLLTAERWPPPLDMMTVIAWTAAAYAIAAVGVLTALVRGGVPQGWQSETAFWACVGIVCLLLIAGIPPWFWQIPFVDKVQFPWRLMVVVEFAVITAVCLIPWPVRFRLTSYVFVAAVLALVPAVVALAGGVRERVDASVARQEVPADLKHQQASLKIRRAAVPTSAWSRSRACPRSSANPSRAPAASVLRRLTNCKSTSTRTLPPKSSCVASIILYGGLIRSCRWRRPIHCDWWRLLHRPAATPFACSAQRHLRRGSVG